MDPTTAFRLSQIMPQLAEVITKMHDDLLASTGIEVRVTQGLRTFAEQDALFAQRPKVTNAAGGYSTHNFGLAVDLAPGKVNGAPWQPDWDGTDDHYRAMVDYGERYGLNCGADWHSFKDEPHFQVPGIPTTPTDRMRLDWKNGNSGLVWLHVMSGTYGTIPPLFASFI